MSEVFFCANGGEGSVSVVFFCANGGNQSWQVCVSLRQKTKMADSKMVEFKMAAIIKLIGRIQDGHHHQVEWEWMSLSQIELVWVRVRVEGMEGECFWVNPKEDNKVSEFHNAEAESKMAEFKMAKFKMVTIIKLNQNELVKFFCANGREGNVSEVCFCAE